MQDYALGTALAPRHEFEYIDAMATLTKPRMTVDEFLTWAKNAPGRYELLKGELHAMSPEGVGHAERKGAIYSALRVSIRAFGLPCHALPDGATVRIDDMTAYEPDALVYCGEKLSPTALEVPNPVIVVEVLSPSTRRVDVSLKLVGYFRLPSLAHYLIIDPAQPSIIHHARHAGGDILTRIVTDGELSLDPPGIKITLADIYGA
jgi:Uma2 family endonuclease